MHMERFNDASSYFLIYVNNREYSIISEIIECLKTKYDDKIDCKLNNNIIYCHIITNEDIDIYNILYPYLSKSKITVYHDGEASIYMNDISSKRVSYVKFQKGEIFYNIMSDIITTMIY